MTMFIPGQYDPPDASAHEGGSRPGLDPAHPSAHSFFREARKSAMAHVPRRSSPLAQTALLPDDASAPPSPHPKPPSDRPTTPTKQPSVLKKRPATPPSRTTPSQSSAKLPTLSIFSKAGKSDKRAVTPPPSPSSPSMHITQPRKPGHARSASIPVAVPPVPPVPPVPRPSPQFVTSRPTPPSTSHHDRRQVRLPHPSPGAPLPPRDALAKSSGAIPLSAREYERLKRQAALPPKPPFGTVPRPPRPNAKPSPIARQRTLSVVTEVTDTASEDTSFPGSFPQLRRSRQMIQSRTAAATLDGDQQPLTKVTTAEIALVSPTPGRPVSVSSSSSFISCFAEAGLSPSSEHEATTPSFPGALPLPKTINKSNEGALVATSAQRLSSTPPSSPPSPSNTHRRPRSLQSSLVDVAQRTSRRSLSDAMNRLSHATASTTRSGDTVFFDAEENLAEEDEEPKTPAEDDVQTIPSERSDSEEPITPESISTSFFIVEHPRDGFDRSDSPGSQRIEIPDAVKINYSLPRTPSPYLVQREEATGGQAEPPSQAPANDVSTASRPENSTSAPRAPTPLRRKLTKTRPSPSASTPHVGRSPSNSSQKRPSLTLPRLGRSSSASSSHKKPVVLPWITRPASPSKLPSTNSRSTTPAAAASSPSLVNVTLPPAQAAPPLPPPIRAPVIVPAAALEKGKKGEKEKAGTVRKRSRKLTFQFLSSRGASSSQSTPAPTRGQSSSMTTDASDATSKAIARPGPAPPRQTSPFLEKAAEKKKPLQSPNDQVGNVATTPAPAARPQEERLSPKPLNGSISSGSPPSRSSPPQSLEDKSSTTKSSSRGPSPLTSPSIKSMSSATSTQPSVGTNASNQNASEGIPTKGVAASSPNVAQAATAAFKAASASPDARASSPPQAVPKAVSETLRASSPILASRHRRDGSAGSSHSSLHPRRDASVVVVDATGSVPRSPRAAPPSKLKFAVSSFEDVRGPRSSRGLELGSSLQKIFSPEEGTGTATVKADRRSGQQQQQQSRLGAGTVPRPRLAARSPPRESKRASGASELQKLFAAEERSERGTIGSDSSRRRVSVEQELFYPAHARLAPPRPLRSPARLSSASGSPASLSPARSTTPLAKRDSTPSPVQGLALRSPPSSSSVRVSPQPSISPPPALRAITPLAIRKKGKREPSPDSNSSLSSTSSSSSGASESIALSSPSRYSQSSAQELSPWATSPSQRGRPRAVRNISSESKASNASTGAKPSKAQNGGASSNTAAPSADGMHPMWAVPMITITNATVDLHDLSERRAASRHQNPTLTQTRPGDPKAQQRAKRLPRPQDADARAATSSSRATPGGPAKTAGSGPAAYPTGALRGQERQKAAAAAAMRYAEEFDASDAARSMSRSPESVRRVGAVAAPRSSQPQRKSDLPGVFAREKSTPMVVQGRA